MNTPHDCPILHETHNTGTEVRNPPGLLGLWVAISGNSIKFCASIGNYYFFKLPCTYLSRGKGIRLDYLDDSFLVFHLSARHEKALGIRDAR